MKAFIYRNFHAKGFFSKVSILLENFGPQKWQKAHISERKRNSKKLKKLDPQYFSILEGVILLQLFPIPATFWDMRFWPFKKKSIFEQNTDFWEKSFCMEVSIYKSFHMTRNTPTSEILPPPLMGYSPEVGPTTGPWSNGSYECYLFQYFFNRWGLHLKW